MAMTIIMEIKIQRFEGPLALLLDLIEQNKLDISEVSLKEVAGQYLNTIEARRGEIGGAELADWLLIAAKLLFIKSRSLLPELTPVDESGLSLEDQLKMYKAYRDAARDLKNRISEGNFAFSRQPFKLKVKAAFTPPEKLTAVILAQAMKRLVLDLEKTIVRLPKATLKKTISLAERISELKDLLFNKTKMGFRELLGSRQSKSEIVVSFLALLELVKQKHVWAEQESGEIIITKTS